MFRKSTSARGVRAGCALTRARALRAAALAAALLAALAVLAIRTSAYARLPARAARSAAPPTVQRPASPAAPMAGALAAWRAGPMPEAVVVAARSATPRDACDALLGALGEEAVGAAVVVDVGANKGWPVTRLGLQYGVARVFSVEPDKRNFDVLQKLPKARTSTQYTPMRGAAGRTAGKQQMMFHKKRDDFTCTFSLAHTVAESPHAPRARWFLTE